MLTNLNLTDIETGYKLFRREIIQMITIEENRFGIEPEITAKVAAIGGCRIYEVGISYYGRTYAEGKKIGWRDGFRAIYAIIKYNLFARTCVLPQPRTTRTDRFAVGQSQDSCMQNHSSSYESNFR
jgi:hypothetical protein